MKIVRGALDEINNADPAVGIRITKSGCAIVALSGSNQNQKLAEALKALRSKLPEGFAVASADNVPIRVNGKVVDTKKPLPEEQSFYPNDRTRFGDNEGTRYLTAITKSCVENRLFAKLKEMGGEAVAMSVSWRGKRKACGRFPLLSTCGRGRTAGSSHRRS